MAAPFANDTMVAPDGAPGCNLTTYYALEQYADCTGGCVNTGDTALMMMGTAFVMLQTPAMGLAQAGSIKRKNALSMLMQTLTALMIGSVLWLIVGYCLTFGVSRGGFIGWSTDALFLHNLPYAGCFHVADSIPTIVFVAFQCMFALMVPTIVTGSWAEKMTFPSFVMFITLWPFMVYYVVAHWVWGGGWLGGYVSSALTAWDFAGGITIHSTSGAAAFVVSLMLTRRRESATLAHHNLPLTILGGTLIWCGWYSFNGASAFSANGQASTALLNTHLAACTAGMTWSGLAFALERPRHYKLTEIMGGALAGLAGVTPGSGFIDPWAAFVVGIVVGVASWVSVRVLKGVLRLDDVLDVTSLQGVPGVIGSICVGLFANPAVHSGVVAAATAADPAATDEELAALAPLGLFFANSRTAGMAGTLLGVQALAALVAVLWSAGATFLLMLMMKYTVGIDINQRTEEQGLDLVQIGEQAYDDRLDVQLDLGADAAHTLLCDAAAAGNVLEVERLVRNGADAHAGDYDGRTPLHLAASEGRVAVVTYLVDTLKVDVNAVDKLGGTPLSDALASKHHKVAKVLREHGARVNRAALTLQLCEAAARGDVDECEQLFAAGAKVGGKDYDARTPLHVAAANGHADAVALLLAKGASATAVDRWGRVPIDDAVQHRHESCVRLLEAAKNAPPKSRVAPYADVLGGVGLGDDDDGGGDGTAAAADGKAKAGGAKMKRFDVREACAAAQDGNVAELKRLAKRKVDLRTGDYDGRTPLHLAAVAGHVHVVRFLLEEHKVNVNAMDRWKGTALSEALKAGHTEVAGLLRAHGAAVVNNAVGSELCAAAATGDVARLRALVRGGTDVNLADYDGRTALHLAACTNRKRVAAWLLRNGASTIIADRFNSTPIDDARREGHDELLALLESPTLALTSSVAGLDVDDGGDAPRKRTRKRVSARRAAKP